LKEKIAFCGHQSIILNNKAVAEKLQKIIGTREPIIFLQQG
jgi:hypothetical protein